MNAAVLLTVIIASIVIAIMMRMISNDTISTGCALNLNPFFGVIEFVLCLRFLWWILRVFSSQRINRTKKRSKEDGKEYDPFQFATVILLLDHILLCVRLWMESYHLPFELFISSLLLLLFICVILMSSPCMTFQRAAAAAATLLKAKKSRFISHLSPLFILFAMAFHCVYAQRRT